MLTTSLYNWRSSERNNMHYYWMIHIPALSSENWPFLAGWRFPFKSLSSCFKSSKEKVINSHVHLAGICQHEDATFCVVILDRSQGEMPIFVKEFLVWPINNGLIEYLWKIHCYRIIDNRGDCKKRFWGTHSPRGNRGQPLTERFFFYFG